MRFLLAVPLVLLILASGCTQPLTEQPEAKNYSINPIYIPAAEWISANTPEDSVFLSWWDNSKVIEEAGRTPLIDAPSKETLFTVSKYASLSEEELAQLDCPECNPHEKITDVVNAFLADNPSVLTEAMSKHSSQYVLVTKEDKAKSYALFLIAGLKPADYLNQEYQPMESAENLVLFKLLNEDPLEGVQKVYSDSAVRIYKKL